MASRRKPGWFEETFRTVVYAVVIALIVRTFAFEPFNIPSGSMIPTLLIGDYLFVSKYSYGYSRYSLPFGLHLFNGRIFGGSPKRGDVVVFKTPTDNHTDFIKRVIGLPGDHIQMKHGTLFVNGQAVPRHQVDDYVSEDAGGNIRRNAQFIEDLPGGVDHPILREDQSDESPANNTPEFVVPPDHYFMMGDNRDHSDDSRLDVGYVPAENLVGRAEFIFLSTRSEFWEVWDWRWGRFPSGIH